jgi:hypothetical protein
MPLESVLLFPGVVFHELAHAAACVLVGAKVKSIRLGLEDASVTHERARPWNNFFISAAPFLFGSAASFACLFIAVRGLNNLPLPQDYVVIALFAWLGTAIAYHCMPSEQDARNSTSTLIDYYRERLLLKRGFLRWAFALITLPIIFLPLLVASEVMLFLSTKAGLGLAWAVALLLGAVMLAGA